MRSRAREVALHFLFQLEFNSEPSHALDDYAVRLFPALMPEEGEETADFRLSPNARAFAKDLVRGVREHIGLIDEIISRNAENWTVRRMSPVDRNIIRIATFEMLYRDDVPPRVAINEAINLAKRYGGERSGAFVNSVLDKIRTDLESRSE